MAKELNVKAVNKTPFMYKRIKNRSMSALPKTATEEYEQQKLANKGFDVNNMNEISFEEAKKINPELKSADGKYYKDPATDLVILGENYMGTIDYMNVTPVTPEYSDELKEMGMSSVSIDPSGRGIKAGSVDKEKLDLTKAELQHNRYGTSSSGQTDPNDKYYRIGDQTFTSSEYNKLKASQGSGMNKLKYGNRTSDTNFKMKKYR